jgi:hypothetical protein
VSPFVGLGAIDYMSLGLLVVGGRWAGQSLR